MQPFQGWVLLLLPCSQGGFATLGFAMERLWRSFCVWFGNAVGVPKNQSICFFESGQHSEKGGKGSARREGRDRYPIKAGGEAA